ncbi:flagella basal body P-ring formation protein FlgA, partial [Bacteriovoracaceae bacterium]|nr:flagella basal body P-ring formation protein FlgA [Bacteriovoracaceae bacterium]
VKTEIGKKIKTFKLSKNIDRFNQEKINKSILPIEIITSEPEKYFVEDPETLKFFRNSRPLKSGDLLLKSWLIPRDLIKSNKQVNVILINNGIQIKSRGIPTQNAGINQMVEIINPLTKKKFLGQVIGESLVKVEL